MGTAATAGMSATTTTETSVEKTDTVIDEAYAFRSQSKCPERANVHP
jgi:hypothetical protein